MRRKIWKFVLPPTKVSQIMMPVGAKVLSVMEQNNEPVLWALVDPEKTLETRGFRLVMTGEEFDDENTGNYIGTFTVFRSTLLLVVHVFEENDLR